MSWYQKLPLVWDLELRTDPMGLCSNAPLKKALCDNSSIVGIQTSNHTLRKIRIYGQAPYPGQTIFGRDAEFI